MFLLDGEDLDTEPVSGGRAETRIAVAGVRQAIAGRPPDARVYP